MSARELLLDCPYCGHGKFSAAGLRQHRCRALKINGEKPPALTFEQWTHAVEAAKTKQSRVNLRFGRRR